MPIGPDGTPLPYEITIPGDEPSGPPSSGYKRVLDLLNEVQASEKDEEDLLTIEKVRTLLQQLLANNQKQQDGLMSGKFDARALRKFSG